MDIIQKNSDNSISIRDSDGRSVEKLKYLPRELIPLNSINQKVFGLNNLRSTQCWCNSLIQALFSCTAFIQTIYNYRSELNKNALQIVWVDIAKKLLDDNSENFNSEVYANMSVSIVNALISEMKKKKLNKMISTLFQCCPDEGFFYMIDMLDSDALGIIFKHRYRIAKFCKISESVVSDNINEPSNTVINLPFTFEIKTKEKFAQYINEFLGVTDDFNCPKCNKKHSVIEINKLKMLQDIVVIRILNTNTGKISYDKVWYPEDFEINTMQSIRKYKLVAQIEHIGSQIETKQIDRTGRIISNFHSSGHYVATCYRNGKYHLFNDKHVAATGFTVNKKSHLLFYHFDGEKLLI